MKIFFCAILCIVLAACGDAQPSVEPTRNVGATPPAQSSEKPVASATPDSTPTASVVPVTTEPSTIPSTKPPSTQPTASYVPPEYDPDSKRTIHKQTDDGIIALSTGMTRDEIEAVLEVQDAKDSFGYSKEKSLEYENGDISVTYIDNIARYIFIKAENEWSAWNGIKPGISLQELEELMGSPLNLYDGTVIFGITESHEIITDVSQGETDYKLNFWYDFDTYIITGIYIHES